MSTYSTNLGIELIGTGQQAGTWGTTTNTNLGTLLEQAVSGYVQYACTGGTDVITMPDGADGTARNMYLELTGTGGGTLQVPAKKKLYFIYNATASAITVKVSGQTGVSVPAGKKMSLVNNGTDVVVATNHMAALSLDTALPVTSGGTGVTTLGTGVQTALGQNVTGSGGMVLATSPTLTGTPLAPTATAGTSTTQLATTAFVTTAVANATGSLGTMSTQNANNVNISGGAITGGTINSLSVTSLGTNAYGTRTVSSSAPSGGANGDIWYRI